MRKYQRTHSWINFKIDLREKSPHLWMNLGESRSKCEHIAGVPLRPSVAEQLHQLYLAKGVLGTTAIEGNTLTEEEILKHLEGKLKLPPSKEYLQQEINNILQVCTNIAHDSINDKAYKLDFEKVKKYNALVLKDLKVEPEVVPGEIRSHSVGVMRYRGAPSEDCEYLLDKLCKWLNSDDFKCNKKDRIVYAIIKAIIAHLYIAWIHPFGDGNGRTARLVEFQILLSAGIPSAAAHLLSNHYNMTRQEYYRYLDLASKSGGNVLPFLEYAIQGFVDGLQMQLMFIREQQLDVTWRNFIYEKFRDRSRSSDKRMCRLALDLGQVGSRVPVSKIPELTPRLAKEYATTSYKTLKRDVAELEQMNLVEQTKEGVRANREIILAFLPPRIISEKE